jgi:hypothetical protein
MEFTLYFLSFSFQNKMGHNLKMKHPRTGFFFNIEHAPKVVPCRSGTLYISLKMGQILPGNWLSWFRFFMVLLSPSRQCWDSIPNRQWPCLPISLLINSVAFIILHQLTQHKCSSWNIIIKQLNNQQITSVFWSLIHTEEGFSTGGLQACFMQPKYIFL